MVITSLREMTEESSNTNDVVLALKTENEMLKGKLKQNFEGYIGIVEAAKKVLERDKEKTEVITRLTEECLQKDADHERTKTLLGCRDSLLSDLENNILELNRMAEKAQAKNKEELLSIKRKLADSEQKVNEKCDEVYVLKEELIKVKASLERKDAELISLQQSNGISNEPSMNDSRTLNLENEVNRLKDKVEELQNMNLNSQMKVDKLEESVVKLEANLKQEKLAREDAVKLYDDVKLEAESYKKRIEELDCELFEAKSFKMSKKGNSMFSEFVDERLKLERDLVTLKGQNDALSNKILMLQNENDNLRQELMCWFTRGDVDPSGDSYELQKEIFSLRSEIESLRHEVPKGGLDGENLRIASDRTSESNKFLLEVCSSLREELKVVKKKLSEVQKDRALYFDKLADSERKRVSAKNKQRILEAEVLALQMKLKKEEGQRHTLKLSKEDKEKLVEVVPGVEEQLVVKDTEKLKEDSTAVSFCSMDLDEMEVNARSNHASEPDENMPEKVAATGGYDESLPLERRVRQVRFDDSVLLHSASSGVAIRPLRRRNFRQPKHEVLQADINANPDCKQQ